MTFYIVNYTTEAGDRIKGAGTAKRTAGGQTTTGRKTDAGNATNGRENGTPYQSRQDRQPAPVTPSNRVYCDFRHLKRRTL